MIIIEIVFMTIAIILSFVEFHVDHNSPLRHNVAIKLNHQVNIVFHCAATVRFDEDLTKSIGMNVSGVLAVVALAKKMARLEVGL